MTGSKAYWQNNAAHFWVPAGKYIFLRGLAAGLSGRIRCSSNRKELWIMEVFMEYLKAFLVGGLFCAVGQVLIDYTKLTPARILVSYVVAGVLLGALGVYKPLVEFAGAGATVPLTGFGYLLSTGVKKAVAEKGLIGVLTGGLTASSAGITAAILFGLIVALVFKPKDKS